MGSSAMRFARSKIMVILTGVVMVALGIAVLVNPIAAIESLIRIIGWALVIYGVIMLVSAVTKALPVRRGIPEVASRAWSLAPTESILGGVCTILGIIMVSTPKSFITAVWIVIGAIILLTGLLDVMEADSARKSDSPLGVPATISGILTVLLGIAVIAIPLAIPAVAMLVAAFALLIDGITEIIFGLGM